MKKFIVLILSIILVAAPEIVQAQDKTLSKREQKKIKKAERAAKEKAVLLDFVRDSTLVVKANSITVNNAVNNTIVGGIAENFIKVDGHQVLIKTDNQVYINLIDPQGLLPVGPLGEITIEGRLSTYDVIEGKPKEPVKVSVEFNSRVLGGQSKLLFAINPSGMGTADVTDARGRSVDFSGKANYP